jgi:ubiquinone/menaquinone biosynthesis C-methylase UbiE
MDTLFTTIKSLAPQSLLDVGCGNGELTDQYTSFCPEVTGIDISDKGVLARETPITFQFSVYDGNKLPFEDNCFDVVSLSYCLHHIKSWKSTLKECLRVSTQYVVVKEPFYRPDSDENRYMRGFWELLMAMNNEAGIWHEPHFKFEMLHEFFKSMDPSAAISEIHTAEIQSPDQAITSYMEWTKRMGEREKYWREKGESFLRSLPADAKFKTDDCILAVLHSQV